MTRAHSVALWAHCLGLEIHGTTDNKSAGDLPIVPNRELMSSTHRRRCRGTAEP
jgi:hypothetical protein